MSLRPEQLERYSRSLRLHDFNEKDQVKLSETTVSMVGAGGIGSPVLRLLTSLGFGKIRIIDGDKVELSNIQRQNIYNTGDIGKKKAECAAANLSLMNPEVKFIPIVQRIDDKNAQETLKGSDLIVDGLDSFRARHSVNRVSVKFQIPYIFAGAVEYFANLSSFIPGKTGCLSCVMGAAKDNPDSTAAKIGVSPELLSVVAGIEAREALLVTLKRKANLAGNLMTIDINTLSFDVFDIARSDTCDTCGELGPKE
ncbi:MAG: HesA/MoeB/ThiF family protein [Candidatus Thorarchaeota archaeon]|jgi:adenylyltransferase/sulfurtransferase